mmetsp:Transcript_2914/g.4276  ORF Transcript_2914/g.4276 Transcript_2914/m.4276 type:complete len:632 (+) Transcript_2914:51-1946(+)|eukprot:CAMPEP_0167748350 /NCGR_PEP_ID=MMETSP0110_2-20121227/4789_1 /TAXON_ID=629695 /ORGANISM="Gymnochlora sp., Strain CCMP2014" /LENGTH=631 /DNA_ID=CAMNT_0007633355 /DNA_START=45 /DNA_END=1940 /DNA_ORIENTATION=-
MSSAPYQRLLEKGGDNKRRHYAPRDVEQPQALTRKYSYSPARKNGSDRKPPKSPGGMGYWTIDRAPKFLCSNAQSIAERSASTSLVQDDYVLEYDDKKTCSIDCGLTHWMGMLLRNYGFNLLFTIFVIQHLMDGFVSRALKISIKFYLRDYGVSAGQLQTYQAVVFLPLCARGLMGLASDSFRIFGYRKIPWIIISTPFAVVAYLMIGSAEVGTMSMEAVMACFVAMLTHLTFCNVLVDAKNSERIQETPKHGSDLISYSTLGRTVWSGAAILSIGGTVAHIGTRWLFRVCSVIGAGTLIPAMTNSIGDDYDALVNRFFDFTRGAFRKKGSKRYLTLACWITVLSVVLAFFGVFNRDPYINFGVAMVVAVLEVIGFCLFTPPTIAKVAIYHLLIMGCQISLSGVYFYFFTDQPHQYPEGPHFSDAFYVLSFGLLDSVSRVCGVVVYNKAFRHLTYRVIFLLTTIAYFGVNMLNVVYCLRWNVTYLGISDHFFVLGVRVIDGLVGQINLMPSILLVSHLCPRGREATINSLIAANLALGSAISKYNGSLVLELLNIKPRGNPNESHQFDSLWIAALLAAVSNAVHVFSLPFLVPDAKPDEKLPEHLLVHKGKPSMAYSPVMGPSKPNSNAKA